MSSIYESAGASSRYADTYDLLRKIRASVATFLCMFALIFILLSRPLDIDGLKPPRWYWLIASAGS